MPAVYSAPSSGAFYGFLVYENLEDFFTANIPAAITSDLDPFLPSSGLFGAYCGWGASTKITSYDPLLVSGYGINPDTYKFGSVTYQTFNSYHRRQYINTLTQTYDEAMCLCVPENYADVPFTIADIPPFLVVDLIATVYSVLTTARYFPYKSTHLGLNGLTLDLAPSVVCNLCVSYYAGVVDFSALGFSSVALVNA